MKLVHEPAELRDVCQEARRQGRTVGVVPTMGALHEGHLSLVDETARVGADFRVVTIFVNPLQFAPGEDLERYPRTLDADLEQCRDRGVDLVFAPAPDAMYPAGFQTHVNTGPLGDVLEGAHREGHFEGVTTVVCKLLSLVGEAKAVFGKKDYQQWRILERMALDLDLPTEIIGHEIVREADGLALSSRNRYLSESERARALGLSRGLAACAEVFTAGERDPRVLSAACRDHVARGADRIDYVEVVDGLTLHAPDASTHLFVALIAAHVGKTRLIDNRELGD